MYVATYETSSRIIWNALLHNNSYLFAQAEVVAVDQKVKKQRILVIARKFWILKGRDREKEKRTVCNFEACAWCGRVLRDVHPSPDLTNELTCACPDF